MIWKNRDIRKIIEKDGWYEYECSGSHRQFKHPTKKGRVTLSGKPSDDVSPGLLKSIFQQAKLPIPRK